MTYEQSYSFDNHFDDSPSITPLKSEILIRVSDSFDGLFIDSNLCTQINNIIVKDIDRDKSGSSAKFVEDELSFSIDEALSYDNDNDALLDFVKQGLSASIYRYVAVFQNTTNPPLPSDSDFIGVVQRQFDEEVNKWDGNYYSESRTTKSIFGFKAAPFRRSVLEDISLKDLINGVDADPGQGILEVVGIDSTWESTNVASRIGYYDSTYNGSTRQVYIHRLVSLDKLLRKLADNLTATLALRGTVLNFTFGNSKLDGLAIPARWNHPITGTDKIGVNVMHVGNNYDSYENYGTYYAPPYKTYDNDSGQLYINPDVDPVSENSFEQIFINYHVIKPEKSGTAIINEPEPEAAKKYRWYENIDSFVDLMYAISENFGMFLNMEYVSADTINIDFVPRVSFNKDKIYFKDAITVKRQVADTATQEESQSYYGESFYYAKNGLDSYIFDTIDFNYFKSEKEVRGDSRILMTISPTYRIGQLTVGYVEIPHNHIFVEGVNYQFGNGVKDSTGITSAMYMRVARNVNHPEYLKEPDYYYTNIAQWNLNIDGVSRTYNTMSDYLNDLKGFDSEYLQDELTVEVPSWNAFSDSNTGSTTSWKFLQIGKVIELNGIDYTIVAIKKSLQEPKVQLKLQGVSRFDNIVTPSSATSGDTGSQAVIIPGTGISGDVIETTASGQIYAYDVVSVVDNDSFRRAIPKSQDYNLIYGVALNAANDGETLQVIKSGEINDSFFTSYNIGDVIWIRHNPSGANIGTFLQTKSTDEDLRMPVFKITGNGRAEIMLNWKGVIE